MVPYCSGTVKGKDNRRSFGWLRYGRSVENHLLDFGRPLYVSFRGVRIGSRFGGKAVRPLGQRELSLSRRSATAPLFARRGESKAL